MDNSARAVRAYFEKKYPERDATNTHTEFRKDEAARRSVLASLLPRSGIASICDIGCGDGLLLAQLVAPVDAVERIHLVDISQRFLALAERHVANVQPDASITTENCSLFDCAQQSFDFVLAIGVTDYNEDWPTLLDLLIARTRDTLVIDFPKSTPLRHILRRLWLLLHGVTLHTISRRKLERLLNRYSGTHSIHDTRYNHIVKIEKAGARATPIQQ